MRDVGLALLALLLSGCFSAAPAGQLTGQEVAPLRGAGSVGADAEPAHPVQATGPPPDRLAPAPKPFPSPPLTLWRSLDTGSARPATPFEAFDTLGLNVADLRGDGRLEVVTLNDNQRAYVLDPLEGTVLAELVTSRPGGDAWGARDINGIAVGDVTGDGEMGLAVLNSAATLTLLRLNQSATTSGAFAFDPLWERRVSATTLDPGFYARHPWYPVGSNDIGADGNPFLAHLPGGGLLVLAQSDGYPAHMAFTANGTLRWSTDLWDGNGGPWAGQLRPGGPAMAVFATDGGHVVAYDAATGRIRWDFDGPAHGGKPGSIPIMPNAYDLRGDGTRSIFVGLRVATDDHTPGWMARQHALYVLLDPDGKLLWKASFPWGNPLLYTHPAAVDVDGDGAQDLVVLDWNTIGHHPGNWEKLWAANLFAVSGADGHLLWRTPIDAQWSNTGLAIADFLPGHPGLEILTEEQALGRDGLSLVGLDGTPLGWMPLPKAGWTVRRGPVLADVDGDGLAEAILPVSLPATGCPHARDVGCRHGALWVFRTEAPDASVAFAANELFDSRASGALPVAHPP
jgi:hypothetical protein